MIQTIAVIGAGTMGNGIAQVIAQNGLTALLFDINSTALEKAKDTITSNLQSLVQKEKITTDEYETILKRLIFLNDIHQCKADFFIEAAVEKIEIKVQVFNQLAAINPNDVIFATNTSSLSVSAIQSGIISPGRVIGMHFFNPAPIMKLVEVVKGNQTEESVAEKVYHLCRQLNKTPVLCKDAPGFIVNRVARHYYLESMKLLEDNIADAETIDALMESSGFKMGPFKLMDLIGMDINLAVSQSLYDAFDKAERFKPSAIQQEKVANGALGKKTGQGFYTYSTPKTELHK